MHIAVVLYYITLINTTFLEQYWKTPTHLSHASDQILLGEGTDNNIP